MVDYDKLVKESIEQGIERLVVGGVIQMDNKILLVERPIYDFMGGIFEIPSGKVEDGETLEKALIREIKEESGLDIKSVNKYVGYIDYNSKSGKKSRQLNFLVEVENFNEIILTEHDSYAWAEKSEIDNYAVTDNLKEILKSI